MLQTAFGSLQSPDCDTEWIIGVNVVTGGVLCVLQTAVGSYSQRTVILSG